MWRDLMEPSPPTPADAPSVVHAFDAVATAMPDAVAVRHGDVTLTYGALRAQVITTATALAGRGVGDEGLVAIHLRRGPDLVATLLAVLWTGAAYVPLDPAHPGPRLAEILTQTRAPLVVTTSADAGQLPADAPVMVLEDAVRAGAPPPAPAPPAARPDGLAYVIFTSGSTGRPKGVMVEHHSLVNVLESFRVLLAATPGDVLLGVTSLLFDIAALELLLPLVVGATLVIATSDAALDPDDLIEEIDAIRPTIVQATPTLWRMLIRLGGWSTRDLTILCGGEALAPDLADGLRSRCRTLLNVYGPSETTIWSTSCRVEDPRRASCIGTPIGRTDVLVVDDDLRPVPVGTPGELLIAGEGLARGYWEQPDLTAAAFVHLDGTRWYRTGDVVASTPTGALDFLGRNDDQVKVNGHRVELGEIETKARTLAGVDDAVVLVERDQSGSARLVAYLVGADLDVRSVRRRLADLVPAPMLPHRLVAVPEVPTLPSGKVDRARLRTLTP